MVRLSQGLWIGCHIWVESWHSDVAPVSRLHEAAIVGKSGKACRDRAPVTESLRERVLSHSLELKSNALMASSTMDGEVKAPPAAEEAEPMWLMVGGSLTDGNFISLVIAGPSGSYLPHVNLVRMLFTFGLYRKPSAESVPLVVFIHGTEPAGSNEANRE